MTGHIGELWVKRGIRTLLSISDFYIMVQITYLLRDSISPLNGKIKHFYIAMYKMGASCQAIKQVWMADTIKK